MSIAPIRLISLGSSLAVKLCQNRESTWDIDCLLDPNVAVAPDYVEELKAAIARVAAEEGYSKTWLNQQVEVFVARNKRMDLFLRSIDQNIILFQGENLVLYAGWLNWALERKVRRVAHVRERRARKNVDIADAAAIVRQMRGSGSNTSSDSSSSASPGSLPMSFEFIRALNFNGFDVSPTDEAIKAVADWYADKYGEVGIAEMVWDAKAERYKYLGLRQQWVWA